jgi:hypothetical protein
MGEFGLGASASGRPVELSGQTSNITAEERAEWLIDYVILHRGEGRSHLLRRAVEQFVAAEVSAYERGRRDAAASLRFVAASDMS